MLLAPDSVISNIGQMELLTGGNSFVFQLFNTYFPLILLGLLFSHCCSTENPVSPNPEVEAIDRLFARCPTADEVSRIDADFKLSFEFDSTGGAYVCVASTGIVLNYTSQIHMSR